MLDIFIRVNSGGMVLSSSDLLLSIATAKWEGRDAREAVHELVDGLNDVGPGFSFTKDLVLKAGLVATDAKDVRFRVSNFTQQNMRELDQSWPQISTALRLGVQLLANFGFTARTLTADSVLIPIADYLYQRGATESYLASSQYRDDRTRIRQWVFRSLLKRGVFGAGLDTLLSNIRRVQRQEGADAFPLDAIESAMAVLGKPLNFGAEEVEALLDTSYGKGQAFVVLAVLYGDHDHHSAVHVDHVFPKSRFTPKLLTDAGIPDESIGAFVGAVDRLPNLQLLRGTLNESKQHQLPLSWAQGEFPEAAGLDGYINSNQLEGLSDDLTSFMSFFDGRRAAMEQRLYARLGVPTPQING